MNERITSSFAEFEGPPMRLKPMRKGSLLVINDRNKNIYLSSRNLQNSKVLTVSELNTYEIMNASAVLFVESSLDALQKNA